MENRDTSSGALSRQGRGGLARPASRYNPLYEMQEQMRRMDALFNRVFGFEPFPPTIRHEFQQFQQIQESEPDVDIYESDTEFTVHAALPGIEPHDIHLEATEDSIVLSAHRHAPFANGHRADQQPANQQTVNQNAAQPGMQSNRPGE